MNATALAVVAYGCWMLIQLLLVVMVRGAESMRSGKPLNQFAPGGEDVPGLGHRVTRAHLNSVENIGPFLAVMFAAFMSNQTAVTDGLAWYVVYARVGQSVIHMISATLPMVMIRGTLLTVQIGLLLYMAYLLATGAGML